jgi:hypothetical protein
MPSAGDAAVSFVVETATERGDHGATENAYKTGIRAGVGTHISGSDAGFALISSQSEHSNRVGLVEGSKLKDCQHQRILLWEKEY